MSSDSITAQDIAAREYRAGFVTDIESETVPVGLSEDVIRLISGKKGEPEWLLEWRLKAYRHWLTMQEPTWANVHHPPIDYQAIAYYSAPKQKKDGPKSLADVDPKLLETYEKLGVPLHERAKLAGVAVDAVFDSVSVATTFRAKLEEVGVIFCSFSEAVQKHPELVRKWLGTVVPYTDNFFATLNSAVFTDGSFCYIPKGVRCPMELSTYFRINAANTGQFERTLIIAEEGAYVSYLEGCTAPTYASDSLHSAVVEIKVMNGARVRYTTIQNWSKNVYNLVTKRAAAYRDATMEWVDGNLGSKVTMKYPAVLLMEPGARGDILSVAFASDGMHLDAGAKVTHLAPHTTSHILSKSVSKGTGRASYRGLVRVNRGAHHTKSHVRCDALLLDEHARTDTYPTIRVEENQTEVGHEATVSKVGDDQLFYLMSRGLDESEAYSLIVNGFIEPITKELPMEYAVELNRLIQLEMSGSVG